MIEQLEQLARISEAEPPAVTRVVFTPTDLQARAFVKDLFTNAQLEIREDPIGNTFARWQGTKPELAPVGTGSHIDAIPQSGAYDGTVGVLGAIEAIHQLRSQRFQPRRSIEIVLFTSEEPTRFGIGCLGSRMLSGTLTKCSEAIEQARTEAGFQGDLNTVKLPPHYYQSFVELHIEQGPILDREQIPIGVVTHIAAPATLKINIQGEGGHAGAVLMPQRHDAFLAAAEIALAAEAAARSTASTDSFATVVVCRIEPAAVNSIPSHAEIRVDVRDIDPNRRDQMLDQIQQASDEAAQKRGVQITTEILNQDQPATCDQTVIDAIEQSCRESKVTSLRMVSRAYHDSLFMSRICPAGMIFIPCRNGVSHRPDEYAKPEDIALGVDILARTLAHLAS